MTQHLNNNASADYLVQVQAQVMTRDDSTQCWVPMGGGGLSNVRLCRLPRGRHSPTNTVGAEQSPLKHEYIIHGERLADKSVVLDCVLKKDIQYTKANPKFHHWNTDEKRYGLTFERSDDAKAFDHGIRQAVAEISDGAVNGEEKIFSSVDLPLDRKNSSSQSASTTSTTTSSPSPHSPTAPLPHPGLCSLGVQDSIFTHPHANHHHLHRVHYMPARSKLRSSSNGVATKDSEVPGVGGSSPTSQSSPRKSDSLESWSIGEDVWVSRTDADHTSSKSDTGLLDCGDHADVRGGYKEEPYVIFDKNKVSGNPHEYSYPSLEPAQKPPAKRESTTSTKKPVVTQPYPPLPLKVKGKKTDQARRLVPQRARCKHCRVMFSSEDNARGSCDSAPDTVAKCIECVTCVTCTNCLIYHCMADADGEYRHPCVCDSSDDLNCRKWTVLTILSIFLPCLWCYWPLHACHKCGVACGVCGGRHKAA